MVYRAEESYRSDPYMIGRSSLGGQGPQVDLNLYNQQQQQATDREIALRARKGEYDAARIRAEGEGSLVNQLPRMLQSGMQGAKFQQDWRQGEQDIRGKQANQAFTEEQLAGARFDRGLKEQYARPETEIRIRGLELGNQAQQGNIDLTAAQIKGIQFDNTKKEAEHRYLTSLAKDNGFPDARDGENMQNYMQRMDIEGKRVNLETARQQMGLVTQQIIGAQIDNKFKEKVIRSNILAQQSAAAANAENIATSRQARDQSALQFQGQQMDLAAQDLASVWGQKGTDPQQASVNSLQKYKISPTQQNILAIQNKAVGVQGAAKTTARMQRLASDSTYAAQEKVASDTVTKANNYASVLANLETLANSNGFGYLWDDASAANAKKSIIATLDTLSQQNPAFGAYARQLESPGFFSGKFSPSYTKEVVGRVRDLMVNEIEKTKASLREPTSIQTVNESLAALKSMNASGAAGRNPFGKKNNDIVMGGGQSGIPSRWQQPLQLQGNIPQGNPYNEMDVMLQGGRRP